MKPSDYVRNCFDSSFKGGLLTVDHDLEAGVIRLLKATEEANFKTAGVLCPINEGQASVLSAAMSLSWKGEET